MNPYVAPSVPLVRVKGALYESGARVPGRALPAGMSWTGHDSTKARTRRLRKNWAWVEKLPGQEAFDAREAMLDAAAEEKDSENALLQYAMLARLASEELGTSWPASARVLLMKREEMARLALDAHERRGL